DADPVAVIAPGENAVTVGLVGRRNRGALAVAIAKLLNVDRHIDRQSPAPGPTVVWSPGDVGVAVSAVRVQHAVAPPGAIGNMSQNRSEDRDFTGTLQALCLQALCLQASCALAFPPGALLCYTSRCTWRTVAGALP